MLLFAKRDSMTVFSSFVLPDYISKYLLDNVDLDTVTATYSAQLITPVSMQILSTPLHLLGLDIYNRGKNISIQERLTFIKKEYSKTLLARMSRIFPAFGIGGVINRYIRKEGKEFINRY